MPFTFGGKGKGADRKSSSESEDAAQDILDAFKEEDATALNMALKRHYELCAAGADDDEDDDEAA